MNRPMMDMRMMRDMARGRRRMNVVGQRTDMAMDGRNRYGSSGGYVSSRRPRRDRAMEEDMARGMTRGGRGGNRGSNDYGSYDSEYDSRYDNDYGTGEYNTRDSVYGRELYGYYGDTPFEIRRSYPMRDYNMDYARGGRRDYGYDYNYGRDYGMDYGSENKLNKEELEEWDHKLMKHMDEKSKEMLKKDRIIKKAEEMGIKFEEFIPEEFYVTVLMIYTDFGKTIGSANLDMYIRLAKDWLCDEDAGLQYGEKLSAYYYHVINA